jgi:hypothetical protein
VLVVYETHQIVGQHEAAFERAYRIEWARQLAETSDARLLWYFNIAHGAGRSYQIITLTALSGGKAWESLRTRLASGDLASWLEEVRRYRYRVDSKVLVPEPDSPLAVDLASLPGEREEADPGLYIEEVVRLGDDGSSRSVDTPVHSSFPAFELFASFTTAFGTGVAAERTSLYRIRDLGALVSVMTGEPPRREPDLTPSATSRVLRTAAWSPLL